MAPFSHGLHSELTMRVEGCAFCPHRGTAIVLMGVLILGFNPRSLVGEVKTAKSPISVSWPLITFAFSRGLNLGGGDRSMPPSAMEGPPSVDRNPGSASWCIDE